MTTFARVTPTLSDVLWSLPAGAQRLHEWLLQHTRPGQPYETFLEKFVERSGYCLRHAKRSLDVLINKNIVEIVHRYSGKIYTLIVHDDRTLDFETGTKKSQSLTSMSESLTKMSKTEGSNSDSAVTKNREVLEENRDNYPLHPVNQEVKPRDSLVTSDIPESKAVPQPVSRNFRQELENTLQQPLNKNILAVLLQFSESRARDALDALLEMLPSGNVKNPAGFFVTAMRKGYKPNHARRSKPQVIPEPELPKPEVPDGFQVWLELALKVGAAIASGHNEQGELMIYGPDSAEPYEQACQTWPLKKLQQMVELRSTVTAPQPLSEPPATTQKPPQGIDEPRQCSHALARLQAKWRLGLPKLRNEAIAEAKLWGFDVTSTGIFEVAF